MEYNMERRVILSRAFIYYHMNIEYNTERRVIMIVVIFKGKIFPKHFLKFKKN